MKRAVGNGEESTETREYAGNRPESVRYIYFMQCNGDDGPIKIGHSSDPYRRLSELRAMSPYGLVLIAEFVPVLDVEEVERLLHDRFRASRMHGEWFACSEDLLLLAHAIAIGGQTAANALRSVGLDAKPSSRHPSSAQPAPKATSAYAWAARRLEPAPLPGKEGG